MSYMLDQMVMPAMAIALSSSERVVLTTSRFHMDRATARQVAYSDSIGMSLLGGEARIELLNLKRADLGRDCAYTVGTFHRATQ